MPSRQRAEEDTARLAAIVETAHDAIIGLTSDGVIATWNRGAERIYGYTADEAVGQPLALLLPAARTDEARLILDRMRRSKTVAPIETTRRTKDGRIIHVSSTVSLLRNPADKLIAGSVIDRDITEGKRTRERQGVLVAELNHRVKNTLAAVISIAANTLRSSGSLEEFHAAFEGRIHALAKAHDLLSASGWTGADIGRLVETELAPYGSERISIGGEKVTLNSAGALSFALILHELATNAAKYGALSRDAGRIKVCWHNSDAAQRFVVEWTERGGPPPENPPRRKGFGLGLIERSVKSDLQGSASLDFTPAGLRCRIDVPLNEVKSHSSD